MDKLNLIEKLKTLKQWQLEQKLDFENLQSEYHYSDAVINSQDEIEEIDVDENKENLGVSSQNQMKYKVTQNMFLDRVPPNILSQALRQANISLENTSIPTDLQSNQVKNNVMGDSMQYLNNPASNNTQTTSSGNLMNSNPQVSDYPGTNQLQTLKNQQNASLSNWHMSGLQTVVFQDNVFQHGFLGDEITPIKPSPNSISEMSNYECSESEDGFSESDHQEELDGFKPLSETDEEEEDADDDVNNMLMGYENENENEMVMRERCDSSTHEEVDFFVEENENTVIQMNVSEHEITEDRPITPGVKGNRSFQELIENEIQKEDQGQKQKGPVVSSTPVKSKKHTFLKRGEGLKRFECGNYAKHRTIEKNCEGSDNLKVVESKAPVTTKTFKSSKSVSKQGKTVTKGILKNNSLKTTINQNVIQSNEKKVALPSITEGKVSSDVVMKIINERKTSQDNKMKMVIPEDSRKVTFDKVIRKEILDDFSIASSSLDASFQNMLKQYKEKDEREDKELDAFEALEEAAENVSLSSNSSVVIKYLGRSHHSVSNDCHSESKDEMPLIPETVASYDFDDEGSWSDTSIVSTGTDENDETVLPDSPPTEEPSSPPKRIISKRKTEENKSAEIISGSLNENQGNQKSEEKEIIQNSDDKLSLNSIYSSNNISDTVKKKLAELEKEITKFRSENSKLSELRTQRENDVKQLRKEIETFQKEKSEELEKIEEYRNEEMKKMKNERRLFDKYQKEIKAAPNKQEREELKELRAEVTKLKEELKNKESKFNSTSHRFRTRIVELEEENKELREEICVLEKQRLQRWKTTETSKPEACEKNKNTSGNVVNGIKTDSSQVSQSIISVSPTSSSGKYNGDGNEDDDKGKENKLPEHYYHLPGNIGDNRNEENNRKEIRHSDGKVEVILSDQSRVITFPNGTKKTISKDEKTITVAFFNGDIKKILPNNKLVYYYAESRTTHTTFPDGQEMLEFPNNQVEKRYPDGKTEVIFPDHTVKYIYPDGSEETIFADGTVQKVNSQGVRTIIFANGQKEIHTKEYKRREYPNGTVKTVYEDGRQETKYSTGRLRVKDRDGNLLMDTGPK